MQAKHLIFSVAAVCVLAACSSSKDNDKVVTHSSTVTSSANAGKNPAAQNNKPVSGYYVDVKSGSNSQILPTGENNQNINNLKVGNTIIPVTSVGRSAGVTRIQPGAPGSTAYWLMTHLNHLRYGAAVTNWQEADKKAEYLFAQGFMTDENKMPKQGSAVYEGQSIVSKGQGVGNGTSRFNVDFGKKTLSGSVSANGSSIPLSADIKGSQFSGTHQTSGAATKGAFYGPQGEELGGTFTHKDTSGSFGAAKK